MLSQEQEGKEQVIAHGSRTLTKEEPRYWVTRRELSAIVHFIKQYRHYLNGQKFIIRTDNGAARWLTSFKEDKWYDGLLCLGRIIMRSSTGQG